MDCLRVERPLYTNVHGLDIQVLKNCPSNRTKIKFDRVLLSVLINAYKITPTLSDAHRV